MINFVDHQSLIESVIHSGFGVVDSCVGVHQLDPLIEELDAVGRAVGIRRRGGILAIRNLLEVVPGIADLARTVEVRRIAESILGPACSAVRGVLFDKTPVTNWKVSWHQDLTVAVKARADVPGYGPWSEKAGIVSVQPPVSVLEQMLTIRLHLDPCGPENGPLRVIPGSHVCGRLTSDDIGRWRTTGPEVIVTAARGAVLVMRPLLLHASSAASRPGHRRVVHLDFTAHDLADGLEWQTRI